MMRRMRLTWVRMNLLVDIFWAADLSVLIIVAGEKDGLLGG